MKKTVLATIIGVTMMGVCSMTYAQETDPASTNMSEPQIEQSQDNTQSDDMKTQEAESADQSTDQQLEQDAAAMEQNFEGATIDKVGPNGEELFMERGKYFYMNEEGKKVKVKKSEIRDKSDMTNP